MFSDTVRSYYKFQMGNITEPLTSVIPCFFSSLVCLEKLIISAGLEFHFNRDRPDVYGFKSSILAIA